MNLYRSGDKEAQEWALASLKMVSFMSWVSFLLFGIHKVRRHCARSKRLLRTQKYRRSAHCFWRHWQILPRSLFVASMEFLHAVNFFSIAHIYSNGSSWSLRPWSELIQNDTAPWLPKLYMCTTTNNPHNLNSYISILTPAPHFITWRGHTCWSFSVAGWKASELLPAVECNFVCLAPMPQTGIASPRILCEPWYTLGKPHVIPEQVENGHQFENFLEVVDAFFRADDGGGEGGGGGNVLDHTTMCIFI